MAEAAQSVFSLVMLAYGNVPLESKLLSLRLGMDPSFGAAFFSLVTHPKHVTPRPCPPNSQPGDWLRKRGRGMLVAMLRQQHPSGFSSWWRPCSSWGLHWGASSPSVFSVSPSTPAHWVIHSAPPLLWRWQPLSLPVPVAASWWVLPRTPWQIL